MTIFMNSKRLWAACLALLVVAGCKEEPSTPAATETLHSFIVYKTPACECCSRWVDHMAGAGFEVAVEEMNDLSGIKRTFNLTPSQQSCHTAVWRQGDDRYVFEGHIPAALIRKFLQETPENARGLLVPGMPVGSPGMEYDNRHTPYDVLLLKDDGTVEVYAHIDA